MLRLYFSLVSELVTPESRYVFSVFSIFVMCLEVQVSWQSLKLRKI